MRARTLIGIGVAAIVAVGAARCSSPEAESSSASLLPQRLWIDRMPDDERDMIRKFVIVRSVDHGRFGVAELGSVWRHRTDVFKWGLHDGRLQMVFPQDRRHVTAEVRTWECEGEAPDGFELCLELKAFGTTQRMYSRRDWVLRPRPSDDILDDGPLSDFTLPRLVESEDDDETSRPGGLSRLWGE